MLNKEDIIQIKPCWSKNACKEYVKQLRDKTRANTAEHAAEAIEFLLTECDALHKEIDGNHAMLQRQWVGLTDEEIDHAAEQSDNYASFIAGALFAQDKLEEKNT